jgi:hypothetical protein
MFAYNGLQYRRKFEDIVVIENSPNALPTNLILSYYIDRLSKSITTIDTNIIKSRGGDIFEVENPKQAEEVAKFWDNLKNNIPFSTVINKNWSNKNINKISVFNNSETDILSQYQIYKNILHEMFTVLGFNNNEQDKKERQISDEVNSNNDVINHSFFESMVLSRMDGIRRANEKFGLNMYIVKNREPARDLITEIIEEEISQSEEIAEINEEIISTDNTETVDIKEEEEVKEEE